jgi:hypothetical protein
MVRYVIAEDFRFPMIRKTDEAAAEIALSFINPFQSSSERTGTQAFRASHCDGSGIAGKQASDDRGVAYDILLADTFADNIARN